MSNVGTGDLRNHQVSVAVASCSAVSFMALYGKIIERSLIGGIDIYALNHLNIKYLAFRFSEFGTAMMNLFLTVVASLPALTISVAVMFDSAFLTETM